VELCGNGLDDDLDGLVDEDCGCSPGATRSCWELDPALSGVGICRAGLQRCLGGSELQQPAWGACEDRVVPAVETCNGIDDDCDGTVDEGLTRACSSSCGAGTETCTNGGWLGCTAPAPQAEVCNGLDDDCDGQVDESLQRACSSACGAGVEVCSAGAYGACSAPAPQAEVCGNGVDDDCDGMVDENCTVCIRSPSLTAWQIHDGAGPTCWPQSFGTHGDVGEYVYASIPAENDSGWRAHAAPNISFADPSTMCGQNGAPDLCACRAGGDFTYFQTAFDLPQGFTVNSLAVSISDVDDGVRITLYNAAHPNGLVAGHAFLGGGSTADLAQYVAVGRNRVVLTHVDDCCRDRRIANATISLNGMSLNPCP